MIPAVAEARPLLTAEGAELTHRRVAVCASILVILGVANISSTASALWSIWTTNALKSIGMFIPLVSLVLILRVWRRQRWQMQGTWWGLVVLVVTAIVVHLSTQAVLIFTFSPKWFVGIPPYSLVAFGYVSGAVLLFGGTRLYRAALFPIILISFVDPIPHIFNVFVDLPLQRASAHVARAFAIALGQKLTPDQMRLMFTPKFGMFIAPGCNGIRGASTMGFIALIAGYLYRFRWRAHALVVVGAVLLGYVFNFARLCTLVLYYLVALRVTWLQTRATMGDYIIGGCLFLVATVLLFYAIQRLGEEPGQVKPDDEMVAPSPLKPGPALFLRLIAMVIFVAVGVVGVARAYANGRAHVAEEKADATAMGQFPQHVGSYTLVRLWNENYYTGPLIYHWAEYAPADGGAHISLGISPVLGAHDTLICHTARGEEPLWAGQIAIPMAGGVLVDFSGSFFNSGATQYLEVNTICNGASCGEYSRDHSHFGFVYSKPEPQSIFTQDPARPIPILIRAETIDTTLPADVARTQLTADIRTFLASVDLKGMTQPYRHE